MPVHLVKELPTYRSFSKVEAYYSLRVDYRKGNTVSALGLANRWGWSREKVQRFLNETGFKIVYPKDTRQFKKQWGYLRKKHKDTKNNKGLRTEKSIKHKETHKMLNDDEAFQTEKVIRPATTVSLKEIPDKQEPATAGEPPLGGDGSLPLADGEAIRFRGSVYPRHNRVPRYFGDEGIKAKISRGEVSGSAEEK